MDRLWKKGEIGTFQTADYMLLLQNKNCRKLECKLCVLRSEKNFNNINQGYNKQSVDIQYSA